MRAFVSVALAAGLFASPAGATILSTCDTTAMTLEETVALLDACSGTMPTHVVCINDFVYDPPVLAAAQDDVVAWINLEVCGDNPVEALVGENCSPVHWVEALPATGPALTSGRICAPGTCAPGETNVFCTQIDAGIEHYTCLENAGHTILMHGAVAVP